MADVLRIEGLAKSYGGRETLSNVSLSVAENEYVSLLGPSGSGKTVFLRLIAGFEVPDAGTIFFQGRNIVDIPSHERGIGFVFQNFALFPHLSVFDNISFGLTNRVNEPLTNAAELRRRVMDMIELVGLTGLESRGVHQISGGQKQRVALARTLVTEPKLVLLDEPLGALDANLRLRMRGELRRIRAQLGVTFLHVTGGETEALAMGDRIVVLDNGKIGQFDNPDEVFNRPVSPNVARSLNCYNLFDGQAQGSDFVAGPYRLRFMTRKHSGAAPAYAIRQDLITIGDGHSSVGNETGLTAKYVTSEYTGSAFMYFFESDDGHIIEVENHLSHRPAQDLEPGKTYQLAWKISDAIVYE